MIGWREWVSLPELGNVILKAKIDTGARTSSLHAWNLALLNENGEEYVTFELHPIQRDNRKAAKCMAPLIDRRIIKSSTGHRQQRFVISTLAQVGQHRWPIELSLTRRDEMGFRMLLGRAAIREHFLINPGKSFLAGMPR